MKRRTLLPLLALVLLPGCRTVYTQAPAATLDEVVARLGEATVTITLDDGTTQRIRRLRLTDSTLVYSPSRLSTVHEVRRNEVLQLASFNAGGWAANGVLATVGGSFVGALAGAGGARLICGVDTPESFPSAMGALYCGLTGFAVGGISGALLTPAVLNPRRTRIEYRRPPPR